MKDERLSPMTYHKLKEMGYSKEDWKDLSQEEANKIVSSESAEANNSSSKSPQNQNSINKTQSSIKLAKPSYIEQYHSWGSDLELNQSDVIISKDSFQKVSNRVNSSLKEIEQAVANKQNVYNSQYFEANGMWAYYYTNKFVHGLNNYKDAPVSVKPVGNDAIVWNKQPDVRYGFRNAELRTPDEEYQIVATDDTDNIAENNKTLKTNTINLISKWLNSNTKRNGISVNVFMSSKKTKQALEQAISHNNTKGYLPVTVTKKPRNKQIEIRVGRYTSKVPINEPDKVLKELSKGFQLKNL